MKYLGSKRRIAKDILPIILDGIREGDYFMDAFCGGCNLLDKVPDTFKRIANDKNEYLIAMWKRLQQGDRFMETISMDLYVKARETYRKEDFSDFTKGEKGRYVFLDKLAVSDVKDVLNSMKARIEEKLEEL